MPDPYSGVKAAHGKGPVCCLREMAGCGKRGGSGQEGAAHGTGHKRLVTNGIGVNVVQHDMAVVTQAHLIAYNHISATRMCRRMPPVLSKDCCDEVIQNMCSCGHAVPRQNMWSCCSQTT